MTRHEPFGQCLQRILRQEGWSATKLAGLLGYKSRNSLFRILKDQASYEAQAAFLESLRGADVPWLTSYEAELEDALELRRVGLREFLDNRSLLTLLRSAPAQTEDIAVDPAMDSQTKTFAQLLAEYAQGESVRLLLCNCCDARILSQIYQALCTEQAACATSILHFFLLEDESVVDQVLSLQPLLYTPCYESFVLEPDASSAETEALYRLNHMLVRFTDRQHQTHWHHLIMYSHDRFALGGYSPENPQYFVEEHLLAQRPSMYAIRNNFPLNHSAEDYLAYTTQFLELEADCELYDIKPDVPLNFIHPDILVPVVMDGFAASGFAASDGLEELVQRFYDIQMKRWNNFFKKRKITHIVFSYAAMERFARTGRQTDHFFAMRPYTPKERLQILRFLREQTATNPYFSIYFCKEDFRIDQPEIAYYGGKGVLFTKPMTDYDLSADHSEALITHPKFCERYKNFYIRTLLTRHVLSDRETLDKLDSLIRWLTIYGEAKEVK